MTSSAQWLSDLQLLRRSGTTLFEMTDDCPIDMIYDLLFDINDSHFELIYDYPFDRATVSLRPQVIKKLLPEPA